MKETLTQVDLTTIIYFTTLKVFFLMNIYSEHPQIKREEFEVASQLLHHKKDLESSSLYQKSLHRLEELKELKLSGTLICVGCGPLPTTLIFARNNFSLKRLIGIDLDPEALKSAKQVYFHIFNEILETYENLDCIKQSNEEDFHFFIANMVKPKLQVLQQVRGLASEESIVIIREPTKHTSTQWEPISHDITSKEWKVIKEFPACANFGSRSIVLTRATNK